LDLVGVIGQHQENLELFVVVAWFIWYRRNKNRLKEPCIPLGKIFEAAQTRLLEFQKKVGVKWKALSPGKAGVRVVVRNENGEVMASLAEKITKPASVEVLEALAAKRVAIFSMELGLHRVIIERDSEIVFKALSGECLDCSCIGHIIKDCKSILGFFQTYFFSHTRR